jgi:uncharacterized protein (DUF2235 family)
MSKRIVFCADGTWDSSGNNTNVYRIFKALLTTAGQVPYYDDGVGADGLPIEKLAGGAFGAGLFQKIKDGYTKIAQVYEQGDELFLFGFSRGAYTVRCLAGMIAVCGLPTANFTDQVVETAFQAYRNKDQRAELLAGLNKICDLFDAKLAMVGVWDTVGSLGIPAIFGGVDSLTYGFLDTSLHPDVLHAYHALVPGQTLEQTWFCGVHCDVGGSYADDPNGTALSDLTLGWMMSKASSLGVQFDPSVQSKFALPMDPAFALDTKHESWNVLWGFPKRRSIDAESTLANSVYVRCEQDSSYRPGNLTFAGSDPAPSYQKAPVVTNS